MPLRSEQVNRNVLRNYSRRTLEFLVQPATRCNTQGTDELLKIDGAVLVLVEDVEHIVGKLSGVTKGEELLIYPGEFRLVELTRGAVLEEALIPAPQCS